MDWTWGWTAVGAIATWFLVLGIVFAFVQVRQARRSTNAQLAVELFKELRGDKTLEITRFIYNLPRNEVVKNLSKTDKDSIDYVLDRLGILGALINNGIIDEKLAIEAFGGVTVLKCWYQLKDYIEKVRERRGSQWCANVEDFAYRALKHWKARKANWIRFSRSESDTPIDLVEVLTKNEELRPRCLKEQVRKRKS